MIAQVIINTNVKTLNKYFSYHIPENLENTIQIGDRVLIPFGKGDKVEEGFVVDFVENCNFETKDIIRIVDSLSKENIELAKWMAKQYFCNIAECIKLMLPPGTTTKKIENRMKEKMVHFVKIQNEQEARDAIENKKIKSPKQLRVLQFLLNNGETVLSDVAEFADTTKAVMKTLEKNGWVSIFEKQVERNALAEKQVKASKKLVFTKEQEYAYQEVAEAMDDSMDAEFLLFGVTGSGKTEVYLQLIEKAIMQEKDSIMLVPEISLTPQMVNRFIARFGEERIAVLHSKLSLGERYDAWHKIKQGRAKIIIGARSAIFAPVQNLGLIIIDEEHDTSYKSEMTPKYDAKEVARYLSKQFHTPLLLGSATPDLQTFYKAKKEQIELLELTKRANHSKLPKVEIVDLREELAKGNRSMFSEDLYQAIQMNLEKKEQTILFLNRRGYSTFIMCRDCGYTAKCKNCNISLTYHRKENILKCHYCGYEQKPMKVCPECGSQNIRYFGTGTQKVEEEIAKIFPQATTIRMDIDTVTKKNSHEEILKRFQEEQIDILIGTQMVVKGHHFPNVTLVGVLAADSSLNMEDYRANERTFQILTQVAGRAGREQLPGKVIIQTYNPDNIAIELASKQDYKSFYDTEIAIRKQLKYPPFCDIIVIGVSGLDLAKVKEISKNIHQDIKQQILQNKIGLLLYPVVPAPIDKINNKYRYRILIKCIYNQTIQELIQNVLAKQYTVKDIRISIDINPNNMM